MNAWYGRRVLPVVGFVATLSLACPSTAAAAPARLDSGHASSTPTVALEQAGKTLPFSDREVAKALGKARDDVSFSVRDRRTGRTYTYNGGMRNSTASVVKVLVLATIIRERRSDGRGLSSGQKSLADRMIRYSDNDATTSLIRQAGGRSAVQRMAKDLGMSRTTLAGAWGRTSTSAADQRLLMDKLVDGTPLLSKSDRRYILDLMGRVAPEQRWGVGSVPRGQSIAVKNGWAPLSPRGWRVNSIGSVKGSGRDYTLAILSYDNASMKSGVDRVKTVSSLVWRTLGSDSSAARAAVEVPPRPAPPFWLRRGAALPPHPIS